MNNNITLEQVTYFNRIRGELQGIAIKGLRLETEDIIVVASLINNELKTFIAEETEIVSRTNFCEIDDFSISHLLKYTNEILARITSKINEVQNGNRN